jgi:hypothetical protein
MRPVTLVHSCPMGGATIMKFCGAPFPLNGGLDTTSVTLGQGGIGWPATVGAWQTWEPSTVLGNSLPGNSAGIAIPIASGRAGTYMGVR